MNLKTKKVRDEQNVERWSAYKVNWPDIQG